MKRIRLIAATTFLGLAMGVSTYAGDMQTPGVVDPPPPPPANSGESYTGYEANLASIDSDKLTSESGDAGDRLIFSLLINWLSLY